jgi:ACR3 family arsenite efflux pump ArsB
MICRQLLKIDLSALGQIGAHWRGIVAAVGVNWLVKPFSMTLPGLEVPSMVPAQLSGTRAFISFVR